MTPFMVGPSGKSMEEEMERVMQRTQAAPPRQTSQQALYGMPDLAQSWANISTPFKTPTSLQVPSGMPTVKGWEGITQQQDERARQQEIAGRQEQVVLPPTPTPTPIPKPTTTGAGSRNIERQRSSMNFQAAQSIDSNIKDMISFLQVPGKFPTPLEAAAKVKGLGWMGNIPLMGQGETSVEEVLQEANINYSKYQDALINNKVDTLLEIEQDLVKFAQVMGEEKNIEAPDIARFGDLANKNRMVVGDIEQNLKAIVGEEAADQADTTRGEDPFTEEDRTRINRYIDLLNVVGPEDIIPTIPGDLIKSYYNFGTGGWEMTPESKQITEMFAELQDAKIVSGRMELEQETLGEREQSMAELTAGFQEERQRLTQEHERSMLDIQQEQEMDLVREQGRIGMEQLQEQLAIERGKLDLERERAGTEAYRAKGEFVLGWGQLEQQGYETYIQDHLAHVKMAQEDKNLRYSTEQQEQLARITGQDQEDIASIYADAQTFVARENGRTQKEVAEINKMSAVEVAKQNKYSATSVADIQRKMQEYIAEQTNLTAEEVASIQTEGQKSIAVTQTEAEKQMVLDNNINNLAIATMTTQTEAEIAELSTDAQIDIAGKNNLTHVQVATITSSATVEAAEKTGLSTQEVEKIKGQYNLAIANATGLDQKTIANIQATNAQIIANIQAGVALTEADIQGRIAEQQIAEGRYATDIQQQIAGIQAGVAGAQTQAQREIAELQRQAQEYTARTQGLSSEEVARIQAQGGLGVAQAQANPFGLTTQQYLDLQGQQARGGLTPEQRLAELALQTTGGLTPEQQLQQTQIQTAGPRAGLGVEQYIDLQESLARGGLTPDQQIQLYQAQQQAQGAATRGGLSPEQYMGLQESVARGGLTPEQRLTEQQQGQQVQSLTSLLTLLSNPSALGALSGLITGQTPFGESIPSAAALQGRSNEFLDFLQGAFGALGVTPSALVNLIQGVTPGGVTSPFGALGGAVAY